MKRIILSSVFVVLFLVLTLILFQRVGLANNFPFDGIDACQTGDPNDPNDPNAPPEPEFCYALLQVLDDDDDPNDPNAPPEPERA